MLKLGIPPHHYERIKGRLPTIYAHRNFLSVPLSKWIGFERMDD
ncbi:hypothetical protein [Parachlamydia sp. AcF125]|nr:hypothetical protein [Parachlamydia sp. AcF125]